MDFCSRFVMNSWVLMCSIYWSHCYFSSTIIIIQFTEYKPSPNFLAWWGHTDHTEIMEVACVSYGEEGMTVVLYSSKWVWVHGKRLMVRL